MTKEEVLEGYFRNATACMMFCEAVMSAMEHSIKNKPPSHIDEIKFLHMRYKQDVARIDINIEMCDESLLSILEGLKRIKDPLIKKRLEKRYKELEETNRKMEQRTRCVLDTMKKLLFDASM